MDELFLRRRINELEARVAELEPQAASYDILAHARHDLLVELDAEGGIRWVSQALLELAGLSEADCLGRSAYAFITPEARTRLSAESPTMFDWAARRMPFEVSLPRKDGDVLWLEGNIYAHNHGANSGFFCLYRDISEGKLLHAEHHRVTEGLSLALSISGVETLEFDLDEGLVWQSPGYAALFGKTGGPVHWSGVEDWLAAIHPDDRELIRKQLTGARTQDGKGTPEVVRVPLANSALRYLEISAHYTFRDDGSVRRIIGAVRDVSADQACRMRLAEAARVVSSQQQAQSHLERLTRRSQLAVELGEIGLAEWDIQSGWSEISPRYRQILGLSDTETPPDLQSYIGHVHPDERDLMLAKVEQGFETGFSPAVLYRYQRSPGCWMWIESTAVYERDAQGQLQHVMVITRDLTVQKAVELSLRTSLERLSAAMHVGRVEVFERDMRTDDYSYSPGFLDLLGWPKYVPFSTEELERLVLPEDRLKLIERSHRPDMHGIPMEPVRFRLSTDEGSIRWLESTSAYFYEQGEALRSTGAIRDITAQVQAEDATRAQTTFFEALVENSPDIIIRIDGAGRFVLVNSAIETLLGISVDKVLGRTPEELPISPERAAEFRTRIEQCFTSRDGDEFEIRFGKLPQAPWLLARYVPEFGPGGEMRYILAVLRDVTMLKEIEQEALANARQLGQILETAEEGVVVVDPHNIIIFTNPKIEQIFGYDPNELIGKHESLFQNDPEDTQWQQRTAERAAGLSESYTHRFRRKDGSTVMCWVNAKPLFDENGVFTSTLAMLTDVSDLERSEGELRQTIEWLEFAMESAQIAGLDISLESGRSRATVLFREWFGIPDLEHGFPLTDWLKRLHDDDRERVENQVRSIFERGSSGRADFRLLDTHGELHWLYAAIVTVRNLDGDIARVVITVVDITDRKQLELDRESLQTQVARGQREESLGTLAGGLAHDLNNLLTAAFGYVDLSKLNLPADSQESLTLVEDTLGEMTRLSQRMLAYAGKTPINPSTLDLNTCLAQVQSMMLVLVGKNVRFQVDFHPGLLPVHGEESQLQQIATELLINAAESLHGREGTITLETGWVPRMQLDTALRERLGDTANVAFLRVTDTGEGMSENTQARIFEPFYSGRSAGRGLGLSVVDGLVRGHRGAIEVQSQPGSGSSFTVYLPLEREQALIPASPELPATLVTEAMLVLVVDDERTLRELVSRALKTKGFRTLLAANGDEALEVLARTPGIDLVLLDLTMPQRDGLEVYSEILRTHQQLKVILMSGYSEQSVATRLPAGTPPPLFLHKPFRTGELLALVHKALANGS